MRLSSLCIPRFVFYLTVFQGVLKATVRSMISTIHEQTGTPQNPVDWSDPDLWIEQRLSGEEAELARRIWEESEHAVNPRYANEAYSFINSCNYSGSCPVAFLGIVKVP